MSESAVDKKERERWEADNDLRTLREASDIGNDGKRMKRAKKRASSEINSLRKIAGGSKSGKKKGRRATTPMSPGY